MEIKIKVQKFDLFGHSLSIILKDEAYDIFKKFFEDLNSGENLKQSKILFVKNYLEIFDIKYINQMNLVRDYETLIDRFGFGDTMNNIDKVYKILDRNKNIDVIINVIKD